MGILKPLLEDRPGNRGWEEEKSEDELFISKQPLYVFIAMKTLAFKSENETIER